MPDPLVDEITTLDRARAALRDGHPRAAIDDLDDYAGRFPRGALTPEARLMRIEAASALGRHAEVDRLARDFLSTYPSSPLARRARALIDSVIDSPPAHD